MCILTTEDVSDGSSCACSFVKQAAIDAINGDNNQYTRPGGQVEYVKVLAEMYSPLFQRELNPMTNIVTFNGAQEGIAAIMAAMLEPVSLVCHSLTRTLSWD